MSEFRWVPGYEGRYDISDCGVVRSWTKPPCRNMKPGLTRFGYREVGLRLNGKRRFFKVHALVLMAFTGPRPDGYYGCHKNGDKADNRLRNLRWDTPAGNGLDKRVNGEAARGSENGQSKLSESDIPKIRRMADRGTSNLVIGRSFGVSDGAIHAVLSGKTWSHVAQKKAEE